VGLLLGPVLGNLRPDLVSFLLSMRYYAGNWPTSMWLFRPEAYAKVDETVTKAAKRPEVQLRIFYDEAVCEALLFKGQAWRATHLSGRALNGLLPRAVDNLEDYVIHDGEWTCGFLIGYNFGEGHFHGHQLLEAIQSRCHLEPGDLRVITLESQPLGTPRQRWAIHDAATGTIDEGYVDIDDLAELQPWLAGDEAVKVTSTMHPDRSTPPWPTGPSVARGDVERDVVR
ncbi:MAG: DUF3556 domain-containing protein, partial [Actinomycetota bacterium]